MSPASGAAAISGLSPTVVHSQRNPGTGRNAKRSPDHLIESLFIKHGLFLCMTLFPTLAKVLKYREGSGGCRDVHTQDVGRFPGSRGSLPLLSIRACVEGQRAQ